MIRNSMSVIPPFLVSLVLQALAAGKVSSKAKNWQGDELSSNEQS